MERELAISIVVVAGLFCSLAAALAGKSLLGHWLYGPNTEKKSHRGGDLVGQNTEKMGIDQEDVKKESL